MHAGISQNDWFLTLLPVLMLKSEVRIICWNHANERIQIKCGGLQTSSDIWNTENAKFTFSDTNASLFCECTIHYNWLFVFGMWQSSVSNSKRHNRLFAGKMIHTSATSFSHGFWRIHAKNENKWEFEQSLNNYHQFHPGLYCQFHLICC